jgi:predicted 3-demethylubiquinone-9 3-methyltransferase (glyoxalase superfamily)/uncharacterized protein YndB with AHSA1/START domain
MKAFTKISIETTVHKPLDHVWNCYTQPEHITQWNFASDDWCCPRASNDLKVGGIYNARMEAKDGSFGFDFEAVYKEITYAQKLSFALGDGREVFVTFESKGNSTRVCTVFDAETENSLELQKSGWQAILDSFKKHAESVPTALAKNTICLWYNGDAEQAAQFYAATFPNSYVKAVHRAPSDFPSGKKGDATTVEFTVLGIPCLGLNGGPAFKHNEAFSFQVSTQNQEETDRYWNAVVKNGGQESACGWCKDKWGISWQITPAVLTQAIAHPDPAKAARAFEAMMKMQKIDVATIEAALR